MAQYFYQHLANCMHLRVLVRLLFVLECPAVIKLAQSYGDLLNSSRPLLQELALNCCLVLICGIQEELCKLTVFPTEVLFYHERIF